MMHFRKLQAEAEITNLCVRSLTTASAVQREHQCVAVCGSVATQLKTGDWLDHLVLCKALQYWKLAVLAECPLARIVSHRALF